MFAWCDQGLGSTPIRDGCGREGGRKGGLSPRDAQRVKRLICKPDKIVRFPYSFAKEWMGLHKDGFDF